MILSRFIQLLSFGKEYLTAAVIYLGLSFCLIGLSHELKSYAGTVNSEECSHVYTWTDESGTHSETRSGCPDGELCCEATGECVAVN